MQLQTVFDHKVHAVNTYSAATCLENSCYQVLNLLVILVNIDWTFKQACFQMVHFFGTRSMYKLYFFLRSSVNGNQVECFTDNFHSRVYSSEQRWALIFDFRKNEIICTSCPWKEYFPNLLETWFWDQIFVYWARYFKFWLLAFFLILLNCAKFEEDWTTFILDILQGSPLWSFGKLQKQKTSKGGPF